MFWDYLGDEDGVWCELQECFCTTCAGCEEWHECEDAGWIDKLEEEM